MFMDAASDYAACRCCILNSLHSGFRLASEAVEKLLKAHIFLAAGTKTKLQRGSLHNPYLLKQELNGARPDRSLDSFDDVLHQLHNHYQSRYFDNPGQRKGASSEELARIDELFVYLVETLPMPAEVKYRSAFFAFLCEENSGYWQYRHWATVDNKSLQAKLPQIESTYRKVFEHLYPRKEIPT
jgi:hypothetical protein